MSRRSATLLTLAATAFVVLCGAAGYVVAKNGAPDDEDAAVARADARRAVLSDATSAARRVEDEALRDGQAAGARRGRRAGTRAGRDSGEAEVARMGVGPTPLPAPLVAADAYAPEISGGQLTERPTEIILGNHSQVESISWTEWGGDLAVGSGTLFRVVACEPSCAEDPGERVPATVKAWQPTFTPDDVRYYSKLTIELSDGERFTQDVAVF